MARADGGDGWSYALSAANARKALRAVNGSVVLGARHSTIRLHHQPRPGAAEGRVYTVEPTGDITFVHVHLGKSVIVHEKRDDLKSQPTGDAGGRVACGIVRRVKAASSR